MEFSVHAAPLAELDIPLLAVPVFDDDGARGSLFEAIDAAKATVIGRIVSEEGFKGESGKTLLVHTPGTGGAQRVLLVGAGKASEYGPSKVRALAGQAVAQANERKLDAVAYAVPASLEGPLAARFGTEGAILGAYRYDKYRTKDVEPPTCERVVLAMAAASDLGAAITRAEAATRGVVLARDLVNGPAVEVTPARLAEVAEEIAAEDGLDVRILDKAEIARRGMNLLLAVAAGSDQEPCLIHLTYRPAGATAQTPSIALVGKGVTFDAGGYNLKTTGNIEDMKCDMAGAAAVLGAMRAVSALAPQMVVHGVVPAAENLVNGSAYKAGDIYRSMNGKTVEIMNTDAEGRLLLADALAYAVELRADRIVDLATLTGACVVALGPYTTGIWSNDEAFAGRIKVAADAVDEDMWIMPLTKRLKNMLKTPNADMKNVGERWGGAITAALFLEEFIGETIWAHLDIAGPAFADKPEGIISKGGTGVGVLTLLELVSEEV